MLMASLNPGMQTTHFPSAIIQLIHPKNSNSFPSSSHHFVTPWNRFKKFTLGLEKVSVLINVP
jgi:hypothetical protein